MDGELAAPGCGGGALGPDGAGPAGALGEGDHDRVGAALGDGFQELLAWPCGQVACWASKSMAKAVRSYPAPALACGEVSASIGVTRAMPKSASEETSNSAE